MCPNSRNNREPAARAYLCLSSQLAFVLTLCINAPFGRFAFSQNNILMVDGQGSTLSKFICIQLMRVTLGIKAWICMELVSPLTFFYGFRTAPLASVTAPVSWNDPSMLLALLFIIHYLNRALVSPLRTPSRSRMHVGVGLCGAAFNLANGFSMAVYLTSSSARTFLEGAYVRPLFFVGVTLWAMGFVGNILHDETLLNIRRKATAKGKATSVGEYYGIPQGMLYEFISFPNYLCEWIEWIGFAMAAAPLPALVLSQFSLKSFMHTGIPENVTPPWIFVAAEVLVMFPRAYRGHQWYQEKFSEYPKGRKAVLPFIL
jgi:3-oxo-5-alpha-steroid 4-dehydrogenase 1